MDEVRLAPRERELVGLVCEGLCAKDIATRMGLTHGSVNQYTARVFKKTGVHSRLELYRWAQRAEVRA